jgi:plastocyanin
MRTSTTIKRAVVAVGVTAMLAPAGYIAAADAVSTTTVKLKGVQFSPRSVTIKKGSRVKFLWAGGTHNLVGPTVKVGARSSGSRIVTFKKKGTFTYVCQLHANMTTTVKVR